LKILFIHEVNWKQKPIFEIHDYPELLSLRGHDVSFIDFPENEKLKVCRKFCSFTTGESLDQSRAHLGSKVRLVTPGRIIGSPLDRFLHSLTFVPLLIRTLSRKKYDVIVLYGVPTNGWQTVVIAKFFGVPVLFRAIDVSHQLRKTSFKLLIKLAERFVYKRASWVSANNSTLADYCVSLEAKRELVSVDYPGLDLVRFAPSTKNRDLQAAYGIEVDDKTIVFMGTLYRFSGIPRFLELISPSLTTRSDIKFLVVGDGEGRTEIENTIHRYGLKEKVKMSGFVNYDVLPSTLNLADVAINTFQVSDVTNGALPWKVVQYLACGLPTVSTPLSGLVAYSKLSTDSGIVFRDLDQSFVQTVIELLDDEAMRKKLGAHAREIVEARNHWPDAISRFEQLLAGLVQKP
jgi:glycosyltransferase involved in cell wall biosynthesis